MLDNIHNSSLVKFKQLHYVTETFYIIKGRFAEECIKKSFPECVSEQLIRVIHSI